jgi:hypothetical protein
MQAMCSARTRGASEGRREFIRRYLLVVALDSRLPETCVRSDADTSRPNPTEQPSSTSSIARQRR